MVTIRIRSRVNGVLARDYYCTPDYLLHSRLLNTSKVALSKLDLKMIRSAKFSLDEYCVITYSLKKL